MILKYILFALLATLFNISLQTLSFLCYDQAYALFIAMCVGTGGGLILKYVLDKYFVFDYQTTHTNQDIQAFSRYSLTGVFTTIIFWGVEYGFDYMMVEESAKYYGAAVGLSIGYLIKFFLDKRFVFVESTASTNNSFSPKQEVKTS